MVYNNLFLQKLFYSHNQKKYARITALDFNEFPQEIIEGKIISGSINVDGSSAVRRTCQLSMVTDKVDISDYLWGINTKIKLDIGLKNTIDNNYPDIIWFPQGIYIITSFSSALSTNSYTINLSGKDKMCMLNGENGGTLPMEVNFGVFEEKDNKGNIKITKYPLKNIIREAVHHYGGEPFHNIIINDLDDRGLELQEYKYDTPMYLLREQNSSIYSQGTLNGTQTDDNGQRIDSLAKYDSFVYGADNSDSTIFVLEGKKYQVGKIVYGQTPGYTVTEMTYTGDLIAKPGETITSVLDKIKQMLGNFEYFYDIDGRFIFQEQKNYLNTSFTPLQEEDNISWVDMTVEKTQFDFIDNQLFTSFNNTPNLSNLRNDFTVWGARKGISGKEYPIHMRYAIDEKPIGYCSITVSEEQAKTLYGDNGQPQESQIYLSSHLEDTNVIYGNNIYISKSTNPYSLFGRPDIEIVYDKSREAFVLSNIKSGAQYYDWREIIYQMAIDYRKWNQLDNFETLVAQANPELYSTGKTGYEQYYVDMEGFWRQLYNPALTTEKEEEEEKYYKEGPNQYWAKDVYEAPERLNFWIDFLDMGGELQQFSVKKIGIRPKVSNDKDVRAIYYRNVPEIIYSNSSEINSQGYTQFNFPPGYETMFSQSTQGKSAKDAIDFLLYNHAYCIESVSVTSVPVYSLQPNKRIFIKDESSGIEGEYILSKYTLPLAYNGTMNMTVTKAIDRIL